MSGFLDPLIAEDIDDIDFKIAVSFRYQSDLLGKTITIPVGFKTDFCSTWSHKYARQAGAVHDWLYYTAMVDRDIADSVLKEAMQTYPTRFVRMLAWPYYLAVRSIFGKMAWDDHRQKGDPQSCF